MARYSSYSNNAPLTHWNRVPIYLTTILAALFVVGLLFRVLVEASRSDVLLWLTLTMPLIPVSTIWRLVTYVFVGELNFFTPLGILCFYYWSVGIETHLGRTALAKLLALLVLVVPAVSALWLWWANVPSSYAGNYALTAGLMIAFATLYPNSEAWGWIPFKWFSFACVLCGSLMLFASRRWVELSQLWASCAVGFAYISRAKEAEYDDAVPLLSRIKKLLPSKPKFRVLPSPPSALRRSAEDADATEMDMLLDKIAKGGMASLTSKERAKLEKAREALIRKDQR